MAELERNYHSLNQIISDDQFNLPFPHLLDLTGLPDERLAAVQRAKLALAQGLPGAVVIIADSSATGGEYGIFDHVHVAWGNEEAELVHRF